MVRTFTRACGSLDVFLVELKSSYVVVQLTEATEEEVKALESARTAAEVLRASTRGSARSFEWHMDAEAFYDELTGGAS
jgi:hypothetical protein